MSKDKTKTRRRHSVSHTDSTFVRRETTERESASSHAFTEAIQLSSDQGQIGISRVEASFGRNADGMHSIV